MKRMLTFLLVFVVVFLAMTVSVEAQVRRPYADYGMVGSRGGGYYGRGLYDPALMPYIQQMMRLPDGLAACSVDFFIGKVTACRPVVKEIGAIQAYLQNPGNSLLGTVHVEKGKMHFRPFDDTNGRIGTVAGGALGAGGGAAIGGGFGGRKGAAIGAVGGAILGGILASRHTHNNCLILEPSQAQQAVSEASVTTTPVVEKEESMPMVSQPAVEVPVEKIIRNRFEDAPIRVYEGSELIVEIKAGEKDERVKVSSSDKVWGEAYIKNPLNDGKCEWTVLSIGRGIDQLPQGAGWVFGNPKTRPDINGGGN